MVLWKERINDASLEDKKRIISMIVEIIDVTAEKLTFRPRRVQESTKWHNIYCFLVK
jgi:hypothetical protein